MIELIEQLGFTPDSDASPIADPRFGKSGTFYLPIFRYFAKLLGCHLRDMKAPIPAHLSRFVSKRTSKNCIWLWTRADPTYPKLKEVLGEEASYVAHGGIVVITTEPRFLPTKIQSTLTIGPVQFVYWYSLNRPEVLELQLRYPDFVKFCADTARDASINPLHDDEWNQVGIIRHSQE